MLDPLTLLRESSRAVPVVKYAVGLVGISAAVLIIRGFLPDVGLVAMFPLLLAALVCMTGLILVASIARPSNENQAPAATALLWAVSLFVIVFMVFTVTAVAFRWPSDWARIILPDSAFGAPLIDSKGSEKVVKHPNDVDKPISEPGSTEFPLKYSMPRGYLQRSGDFWTEKYISPELSIEYLEMSRDANFTVIYNTKYDDYMRWPTFGGMAETSHGKSEVWKNAYMVEPVK